MIARLFASALAVALSSAASGCVTPLGTSNGPPMTVAYVDQHIQELHGKTVWAKGEIDDCDRCHICDGPADADACLDVGFDEDSIRGYRLLSELYRFATVTIEARVDATCKLGFDPDLVRSEKTRDRTVVCIPKIYGFEDARVVAVHARKPATQGRFYKDGIGEVLQRASEEEHRAIRSALAETFHFDEDEQLVTFQNPSDTRKDDQRRYFIACTCRTEDCAEAWPTMSGQVFAPTPSDPYHCRYVDRINGAWVIIS